MPKPRQQRADGRAKTRRDLFPSAPQMRQLLKLVARKRREFPVALCDEMGYAGEWEDLVRDAAFFCAAGRAMCAVLPDGSVMPCSTLDPKHCEGNLNRTSLAEIWRSGFAGLRTPQRAGKCADCKDWAACGSGCWLQRQHGTHCFRHLWKVAESFKAAAGLALGLGVLAGNCPPTHAAPPPTTETAETPESAALEVKPSIPPRPPGLFGSKANVGRITHDEVWSTRSAVSAAGIGVISALNWLRARQNADGSWSKTQPLAMTGLVLQCYVGHYEMEEVWSSSGSSVARARNYLAKRLAESVGSPAVARDAADPNADGHAIATCALAQTYAMARRPEFRPAMEKGLATIIATQRADGGWACGYAPDGDWNLPFTARQVQALTAGLAAGSSRPGLRACLLKAAAFVQRTAFKDGFFRTSSTSREISECAQAAGAYCLLSMGQPPSKELSAALDWIRDIGGSWDDGKRARSGIGTDSVPAGWYYETWAMFLGGPAYWDRWRLPVLVDLLTYQGRYGDWQFPPRKPGARQNTASEDEALAYWSTMYCCLTLEVCCANAPDDNPTWKRVPTKPAGAKPPP